MDKHIEWNNAFIKYLDRATINLKFAIYMGKLADGVRAESDLPINEIRSVDQLDFTAIIQFDEFSFSQGLKVKWMFRGGRKATIKIRNFEFATRA